MRIGLVANTFWPLLGGMEIYLRQTAVHLAAIGHDVHVATRYTEKRPPDMRSLLSSRQRAESYKAEGYHVHVMDPGAGRTFLMKPAHRLRFYEMSRGAAATLSSLAFQQQLAKAVGECAVIHFSGTGGELLGFACADFARKRQIPFVVSPHVHMNGWGDGEMDLALYRRAAAVIAWTEVEKRHLVLKGLAPGRVVVQGAGVNVDGSGNGDTFRGKHNINGPIVLYLGRKNRHKGYERLLLAARAVWEHVPDAVFVLAGPTEAGFQPIGELEEVIRDLRVLDLGNVDDKTREDILDACDVFCLPSEAEAFGLVYLEAGYYGKPVVGLNIPTLNELIAMRGTGILVPADPNRLAEALVALLQNPAERDRLGTAGRRVAEKATWSNAALFLQSLYSHLGADRIRTQASRT